MSEYSEIEEKLNVYSHLLGVVLGLIGLILLIVKGAEQESLKASVSFIIFGVSIVLLFFASSLYHHTKNINLRLKRKVLDHCAIYILIAGTYTPYALGALGGKLGWIIFGVSWGMALMGITFKIFFTGRFNIVSTLLYVLMGWMIVFFVKPLKLTLSEEGFNWLLAGGISYTVGALAYSIEKIKFNHAIFHVFVLGGTFSHYISVYYYI
ncbi:hemolysin III family protein [Bacteriovoracaceae bacterium]|nr:hemolysin III family protein [Bacteriovoracaceae bacterium]